jgi:type IV pilus assembly protein PilQ
MLRVNTGRVRELAGLLGAACAAIIGIACAASNGVPSGDGPGSGSISDVRVEHDGDATMITLLGVGDPVFTAFAQQDPHKVVVDIASLSPQSLAAPVAVNDGLVEEVLLSPYSTGTGEPMTRVEVALSMAADYDVVPVGEGLQIRIAPLSGSTGASTGFGSEADPWAIAPTTGGETDAAAPLPEATGPAATRLTGVEVREAGDGTVVHLVADGVIASAESFTLENPNRLVIDLPGLQNGMGRDKVEIGDRVVQRVRIGKHDDRVRVVVDAGDAEAPFESRQVQPAPNGLVVALGSGPALDLAVREAMDEIPDDTAVAMDETAEDFAAEAAEPPAGEVETPADSEMAEAAVGSTERSDPKGRVTIFGVEYDAQPTRDRVVILGDSPVDYLLYEPSEDTVVLSIQNAVIDPEAAVRIAPQTGGPISLITAFEQPETDGTEVRVVVTRAANLKPEISRRGTLVVVDFPRDGSVAAVPPVLTGAAVGETAAVPVPAPTTGAPAEQVLSAPAGSGLVTERILANSTPLGAPAAPAPAAMPGAPSIDVLQEGGLMDGKQYAGRRVSLDFKDIEMSDILRLIAEVSDLNVIAGDEVQGKVTIRLVDVPWDQALDVILLTKGLGFVRVGNVLRIAPGDLLKQEEEMRLQERRALEQLEDLVVKLQPVNYAQVNDVRGMVSRLLTSRGTVDVDKRTNTLIIKDIPSVIDEATALVKAIDTQTPQVLIESKIVEAALDFSREFGVTWGVGAQPLNDAFDTGSGARTDLGSDAFRLNTTGSGFGNNATFLNPLTANPTSLFNIAGFLLDEKINLDLQLQAAEVNGDGKVISSPRVVTLDNSKATIEQGVSIPFQTFENGDAQLEFVDAVLKLDVTPHITADRSIIMDVKVSRNAPDDSVFTLTGSPAIAKNQVDTETLVKDGQTLVIGGIYVVEKSQRQSRVPYLHSIPMLGALFRSDEVRDQRKELLIFVTPRVVAVEAEAS